MAVNVGSNIEATDFTDAKDRVLAVLGNGTGQSGYGQIVASAEDYDISVNDELVSHTEWNALIDDVNKCYQHQAAAPGLNISFGTGDVIGANASGTDIRTYFTVSSVDIIYPGENVSGLNLTLSDPENPSGTTATLNPSTNPQGQVTAVQVTNSGSGYTNTPTLTITGDYTQEPVFRVNLIFDESVIENPNNFKGITDVLSNITTIEGDANNIAGGQFVLTDTRAFAASTRFSPWGGDGDIDDTIICELEAQFYGGYDVTLADGTRGTASPQDHRRHFFNAGGEMHISFVGDDFTDKDANWNSMFNSAGVVRFKRNSTDTTGDGRARDGATNVNFVPEGGPITGVSIVNGGSGLDTTGPGAPLIATGGSGTGANFTFTTSGGQVTNVNLTNGGSGYRVGDQLFVDESNPDPVGGEDPPEPAVLRVDSINESGADDGGIESALGNFQLTSTYTLIYRKYGSDAYSQNFIDIEARRGSGFNGVGDPYEFVSFRIVFNDFAEGNPNFDERVLASGGTQTAGMDLKRPNDSAAVLIPPPLDSVPTEFQNT